MGNMRIMKVSVDLNECNEGIKYLLTSDANPSLSIPLIKLEELNILMTYDINQPMAIIDVDRIDSTRLNGISYIELTFSASYDETPRDYKLFTLLLHTHAILQRELICADMHRITSSTMALETAHHVSPNVRFKIHIIREKLKNATSDITEITNSDMTITNVFHSAYAKLYKSPNGTKYNTEILYGYVFIAYYITRYRLLKLLC
jgi:hypothetical protein